MSAPGADAEQCRALLLDFLAAIDRGQATAALDLFTPDAVFDARGTALHGHDEIGRFLAARERETDRHTVHVISNDVVRRHDDHELALSALLALYERQSDGIYQLDRILDTAQTWPLDHVSGRVQYHVPKPALPRDPRRGCQPQQQCLADRA